MSTKAFGLYLECRTNLKIILFGENLKAIDVVETLEKPSVKLHSLINSLEKKWNFNLSEISEFVFQKGPGSYTGLRLLDGFQSFLELEGHVVSNFYEFEVPSLLDEKSYLYLTKAFKKQILVMNESIHENIDEDEFYKLLPDLIKDKERIYCDEFFFENLQSKIKIETVSGFDIIKKNFTRLIKEVIKRKVSKNIYYFRSLEEEFKK